MPSSHRGDEPTILAPSDERAETATPSSGLPSSLGARERIAGRYEIVRLLGAGGMGTVYEARDLELDEKVALKVLRHELVSQAGMLERFKLEAKLARRVTHKNVARTFDIGVHEGERFLTMELVDGESLAHILEREGALPLEEVVAIATDICAGLAAAHAAGVVHRDLKPENVLCEAKEPKRRFVVTDFGIARLADGGEGAHRTLGLAVGTPSYMAPEQVDGSSPIDARTDLYALGAMLFELLTGKRPFEGATPLAVATARLVAPPPDPKSVQPSIPRDVAEVVLKAMARKPADRFASASSLSEALARAVAAGRGAALTQSSGLPSPAAPVADLASSKTAAFDAALGLPPSKGPSRDRSVRTVAVLPFRNTSPDDLALSEGLTDEIVDTLSMTKGLRVRSRGAVMKRTHGEGDPREIGSALGVEVVVEGSIRRTSGLLRVSARLVGVEDGFQIWAKRFERPETELLVVADEVARAIAAALTVELDAPHREAPSNPMVIELYLRGRREYRQFWRDTVPSAIRHFEEALALSPDDPTILAALAMARVRNWFLSGGEGGIDWARLAQEAAGRAVALAPQLGEAHLALATVSFHDGDGVAAMRSVKDAIRRAPGLAEAHSLLGRILIEIGRIHEGIRRHESALEIDPTIPSIVDDLARAYALLGDFDKARTLVDTRDTESFTPWISRGRLALWSQDRAWAEQARAQLQQRPRSIQTDMALATLTCVVTRQAPENAPDLVMLAEQPGTPARRRAFFNQLDCEFTSYIGLSERAVQSLMRAVDGGLVDLAWMDRCPILADLRKDPRFGPLRALVAERASKIEAAFFAT